MATNRADTLDPALLRPGRLDRKIEFPLPDRRQKRLIFQVRKDGAQRLGSFLTFDHRSCHVVVFTLLHHHFTTISSVAACLIPTRVIAGRYSSSGSDLSSVPVRVVCARPRHTACQIVEQVAHMRCALTSGATLEGLLRPPDVCCSLSEAIALVSCSAFTFNVCCIPTGVHRQDEPE